MVGLKQNTQLVLLVIQPHTCDNELPTIIINRDVAINSVCYCFSDTKKSFYLSLQFYNFFLINLLDNFHHAGDIQELPIWQKIMHEKVQIHEMLVKWKTVITFYFCKMKAI